MKYLMCLMCLVIVGACTPVDDGETPVRWLDYDEFVRDVQPILAERCGNPSCHGRSDRPFSVYSQSNWRSDPSRIHLDESLSEAEMTHNYNDSCVFVSEADQPDSAQLLLKPLGDLAGVYHGGGMIFEGPTDREYQTLLHWIRRGWQP